jgi:hypothetical protein
MDMMRQQPTPIDDPWGTTSAAAGWPRRVPLVDNRGFLITLVPKGTRLYSEIERGCTFQGFNRWFPVKVFDPIPMDVGPSTAIEQDAHYYTYDFKVMQVGAPTVDTPTLNLIAIVAHFREELLSDRRLPDLRDRFR